MSLYIPIDTRAVNSTTTTSAIGSAKSLVPSHFPPLEAIWNVDVNGTRGTLTIHVISSNNDFDGSMDLSGQPRDPVFGVYDNVSSKLTFMRIMNRSNPLANQVFTGYLMSTDKEIAGFFEALPQAGGTAHRSIFGWYGIG